MAACKKEKPKDLKALQEKLKPIFNTLSLARVIGIPINVDHRDVDNIFLLFKITYNLTLHLRIDNEEGFLKEKPKALSLVEKFQTKFNQRSSTSVYRDFHNKYCTPLIKIANYLCEQIEKIYQEKRSSKRTTLREKTKEDIKSKDELNFLKLFSMLEELYARFIELNQKIILRKLQHTNRFFQIVLPILEHKSHEHYSEAKTLINTMIKHTKSYSKGKVKKAFASDLTSTIELILSLSPEILREVIDNCASAAPKVHIPFFIKDKIEQQLASETTTTVAAPSQNRYRAFTTPPPGLAPPGLGGAGPTSSSARPRASTALKK